jgi:CBS domain-containing protein
VQLALILEDALMESENLVRDFMVRDVIRAVPWQPISAARQLMLATSFSFLPIHAVWESPARWLLISDYAIAKLLRSSPSKSERAKRLAVAVQEAIQSRQLEVEEAETCSPDDRLDEVLNAKARRLLLVLDRSDKSHIVGALTPFDLL